MPEAVEDLLNQMVQLLVEHEEISLIKQDMNFRRFMMRGKKNVTVEWHLVSMAYNLLKLHHKIQTGRLGSHLVVPKTA